MNDIKPGDCIFLSHNPLTFQIFKVDEIKGNIAIGCLISDHLIEANVKMPLDSLLYKKVIKS